MDTNEDNEKQAESCCDSSVPGCGVECCSPSSSDGKTWKTAVFVVVILLASAVAAHSLLTNNDETADISGDMGSSFGTSGLSAQAGLSIGSSNTNGRPSETVAASCGVTLDSIESLAKLADQKKANVAFIFLASEDEESTRSASAQVEAAIKMLSAKDKKVAAFTLERGAEGYDQLITQFSVESFPSVIVAGKGCRAAAVSGEINETKLLRAFVVASTPVSCGPGGCCP
jgi:hypothetical protein